MPTVYFHKGVHKLPLSNQKWLDNSSWHGLHDPCSHCWDMAVVVSPRLHARSSEEVPGDGTSWLIEAVRMRGSFQDGWWKAGGMEAVLVVNAGGGYGDGGSGLLARPCFCELSSGWLVRDGRLDVTCKCWYMLIHQLAQDHSKRHLSSPALHLMAALSALPRTIPSSSKNVTVSPWFIQLFPQKSYLPSTWTPPLIHQG